MDRLSVEGISDKTINYFKKYSDVDENQEALLRFSIYLVISGIVSLGLALSAALLLGIFSNVLIIMLTVGILRTFSGGAHSASMVGCGIHGMIIMNIMGMITKYTHPNKDFLATLILLIFMFSLWSINKYAPADTPGKPITTKEKKQRLQRFSFLTLFIWCMICLLWYTGYTSSYILVYASTLGVLWQSFSLTDWGYALLHHMDSILQMITKKEEEILR